MVIYLATENSGKTREMRAIFAAKLPAFEIISIADLPAAVRSTYAAEESGDTYAANALIKARALAALTGKMTTATEGAPGRTPKPPYVLAEDSGFEVEALHGEPGVYSARFAADDKARCAKIIAALADKPVEQRRARFVACIAVLEDGVNPTLFFGRKNGYVADAARGSNGFGYDPIFCPGENGPTWGELGDAEKNKDSHRSRALQAAIAYLRKIQVKE